jgi:hypothetical protein
VKWAQDLATSAIALQAAEGHGKVAALAELLKGKVDSTCHPRSGERCVPDDMLNVIEHVFMPHGQRASPFTEAEFQSVLNTRPGVLASGGGAGLTVEFPFVGGMPAGFSRDLETALLQATGTQENPQLGSGALLRLSLPLGGAPERLDHMAQSMNYAETQDWTGAPLLGAWCTDERLGLTFVSFLPTFIYRPGLLNVMVQYAERRTTWARWYLAQQGMV